MSSLFNRDLRISLEMLLATQIYSFAVSIISGVSMCSPPERIGLVLPFIHEFSINKACSCSQLCAKAVMTPPVSFLRALYILPYRISCLHFCCQISGVRTTFFRDEHITVQSGHQTGSRRNQSSETGECFI